MQRFRLGRRPYFICWFRSWLLREEGGVMYCTSSRAHYQTLKQKGRDTSCKRWLCSKKQEVYFLIDETQSNEWCSGGFLFVPLLKNNKGRMITTIGAGVLEFQSMSARFHRNLIGTETFPSSHEMLVSRVTEFMKSMVVSSQLQLSTTTWEKTGVLTMVMLIQPCGLQIYNSL